MKKETKTFISGKTRKPYKAPSPAEFDDIEITEKPPTDRHSWDAQAKAWTLGGEGLETVKDEKRDELFRFRNEYETSRESKCETSVFDGGVPIVVNARRMDLDNFRTLLEHIEVNGVAETEIKDFDNNFHTVTDAELALIVDDLRAHGLGLYRYCWDVQDAINDAVTFEEIDFPLEYNGVEERTKTELT